MAARRGGRGEGYKGPRTLDPLPLPPLSCSHGQELEASLQSLPEVPFQEVLLQHKILLLMVRTNKLKTENQFDMVHGESKGGEDYENLPDCS